MPHRLEVTLKPELFDAEGDSLRVKAERYFGIKIESVRTIRVLTIDCPLSFEKLEKIRGELFTNPVTQTSSYSPLASDFDWLLWVGFKPGVMDTEGATAREAMEDLLGPCFSQKDAVYTSKLFQIKAPSLTFEQAGRIAHELLANDIIQRWKVFSVQDWWTRKGESVSRYQRLYWITNPNFMKYLLQRTGTSPW